MKTTATDEIGELLKRTKTIAVVGLSDSPLRPSYGVSAYMQSPRLPHYSRQPFH